VGSLTAYAMAYGLPYTNKDDSFMVENTHIDPFYWRLILAIPAGVALLRSFFLMTMLPYESPKYLVFNNQIEQAEVVLKKIYNKEEAYEQLENLKYEKEIQAQTGKLKMRSIFKEKYRSRLFVGCGLSILQQLSGINAFTMFTNKIFMGSNTKLTLEAYESSRNLTVIFGVVNLVIPFLCSFITPKVGRKTLLIVGNTLCMVCLIIFPFSDTILPILSKIAIFGYAVGYGISLGPIVWMYIPEILPDVGVGVAVLANWVFAVIVIQTFPLLPFGSYNFLFFGGFCAFGISFHNIVCERNIRQNTC